MKKYKEITLEEMKTMTPSEEQIEVYLHRGWVIQNPLREKLINKKIKECLRIAAREQTICTDNAKDPTEFKPLNVPDNQSIKWYKTQYFGWTVSLSVGVGLGYLIFH